jgi:hypothetical protein
VSYSILNCGGVTAVKHPSWLSLSSQSESRSTWTAQSCFRRVTIN